VYFERTTLKSLGLRIQLGHPIETACSNPRPAFEDGTKKSFVVLDVHGIHEVLLDYCNCETAPAETIQLLRAHWFPATCGFPKCAATFRLLERFHLLGFETKIAAFGFYQSLARATDNTGVHRPKVCCQQQ
jgi:hypothetical protein